MKACGLPDNARKLKLKLIYIFLRYSFVFYINIANVVANRH